MKNLLAERIMSANLTKTQRKIADYFINNQEKIGSLSSMEVAQEIGVSDASIIRFSRVIGFNGYADLKENIYNMLVENAFSSLSLTERIEQNSEKYKDENLSTRFQSMMQQNMLSVFRNNSEEDFEKFADCIIQAQNRYVIGLRGCRGIAMNFSRLLSFMLPNVKCLIDGECASINSLQDIKGGDAVLMFVFPRYYKIDADYLELAKKYGAKICLIVNELTSPLTRYADSILLTATSRVSFFNSKVATETIAEYILMLIGQRVDYKERIRERDAITDDQLLPV